ncbi:hypothetical protein BP422_10295 [Brevibacillus formosus]|uniref:Citrate transporter-like domain-containing protein n=1 Tax=Brevibacillus formosus TaxID=54913 RepID=A0A220MFT0_9BACL|nr:citrate:proton symporter [Brevibacillus formosus]ASJ53898.1 hypothetical protein BP422_10295 [Brevibacillus formosus]
MGWTDCPCHDDPEIGAAPVITPLIPAVIGGIFWILGVAYFFGIRERKRLVANEAFAASSEETAATTTADMELSLKRPKLFWFNLLLTVVLIAALLMGLLPLPVLFMIAFSIAVIVNYPNLKDQKERLQAHAGNILTVVPLVFAAGIFTGVVEGTKMVDAMVNALVSIIPDGFSSHLPVIVAITSMVFTFIMANDPYYFGIVPLLAQTAANFGINPVEIGQASLLGQPLHLMSPLVGSVYVLIGLVGIEYGELLRFTMKYAVGTALVMTLASVLFGVLSV